MALSLSCVVDGVLLLQSYSELRRCSWVSRTWRFSARRAAPWSLANTRITADALPNYLGWSPCSLDLEEMIANVADDWPSIHWCAIRRMCTIQLCIDYVARQTPPTRTLSFGFVVTLLARAVSGLGSRHPVINALRLRLVAEHESRRNVRIGLDLLIGMWLYKDQKEVCLRSIVALLKLTLGAERRARLLVSPEGRD